MKNTTRKAFTIVELVIVIAIIAVLAAVLVPTFVSIVHMAKVSNDTQLIRNLNTILQVDRASGNDHPTMQSALDAAQEAGYDIGKINKNAAAENEILWDSQNDMFCYLTESGIDYIPESNMTDDKRPTNTVAYWRITDDATLANGGAYSVYLNGAAPAGGKVTTTVGFDAGNTDGITSVKYTRSNEEEGQTVVICTNDFMTTLTVSAANDTIYHYGKVGTVEGTAVHTESFYEYGQYKFRDETSGHFVDMVEQENGAVRYISAISAKYDVAEGVTPVPAYVAKDIDIAEIKGEGNSKTVLTQVTTETKTNIKNGALYFAGGAGIAGNPYLLATKDHAMKIKSYSDYFKMIADIVVDDEIYLSKKTYSIDLNGHSLELVYGENAKPNNGSVLYIAGKQGKLTITDSSESKTGKVIGADRDQPNKVFSAVRVGNYGKLIIDGGNYYARGTTSNPCIFVCTSTVSSNSASVTINDGYFETATAYNGIYYVLNHQDSSTRDCKITVNGGTFKNYIPGTTPVDPVNAKTGKIILGNGCTVIQNNDLYTVV